jgi:hypothetical protein
MPQPVDPNALSERVMELQRRLADRLPDIDPGDLALILHALLVPLGSGSPFLLKARSDGGHEF